MIRKCREIEAWLSAYLENDLPREDAADVEEHLRGCAVCRARKERVEDLLVSLPELQEDVPFFLKNRLYNIPDIVEKEIAVRRHYFPKWLAAAVGTVVLFLNLFYFTNVFPAANRRMHALVSSVERVAVRTGGWLEKFKESKELIFFTFFGRKSLEIKGNDRDGEFLGAGFEKGGKNG